MKPNLIFFGSFQHYSALILEGLEKSNLFEIKAAITSPQDLNHEFLQSLPPCDLIVTAGYGKLLPSYFLSYPKIAALNLHFSLLPKYKGANPAEWAILMGESETGITLIEMSEKFDAGNIIAQSSIPITSQDTRETLYQKLYTLGAEKLPEMISNYLKSPQSTPQDNNQSYPYARRLTRQDGFIEWVTIQKSIQNQPIQVNDLSPLIQEIIPYTLHPTPYTLIERSARAFFGYPGLWTIAPTLKGNKRMILHTFKLNPKPYTLYPNIVQLEGLKPTPFNQIKNQIIF